MAENLKELWPGWTTVEQIGAGSFGSVFKISRQIQNTTEYAALKVLSMPKSAGELRQLREQGFDNASLTEEFSEWLYRIQNEYALLARMKGCANVVFCEDIRTIQQPNGIGWDIYIKMELLTPLRHALPAQISEMQAIRLGLDICNALVYCQRFGVVHRDIKPENIFVTNDGSLFKLGDFGIARTMEHTTIGTKTGTYEYMAPEVYNNHPYNSTADIYSLGLVMYWMLNDRSMPFFPKNTRRVTIEQRSAARNRRFSGEPIPAPANGSRELKRIVLKACAFDPADRYATAEEMRKDLEETAWKLRVRERRKAEPAQYIPPQAPMVPVQPPISSRNKVSASAPASKRRKKRTRKKSSRLLPMLLFLLLLSALITGAAFWFASGSQIPNFLCKHEWNEATCTSPKTCYKCGQTEGNSLGHKWLDADCAAPRTCSVCGETYGAPLGHTWNNADCTIPKTCIICGATDGGALGHVWTPATCTTPKTCTICGTTEGLSLEHNWHPATCLAPQTCSYCKLTIGEPLPNHDYQELDFVPFQKCKNCGELEGTPYGPTIAADSKRAFAVKSSGEVLRCPPDSYWGENIQNWHSIVSIAIGDYHTVGLCNSGIVYATGKNDNGQCDVKDWNSIVYVAASGDLTLGLKSDGTVVCTGSNDHLDCSELSRWTDIVKLSVSNSQIVGLTSEGKVVSIGNYRNPSWTDIVDIYASNKSLLALKRDGTVECLCLHDKEQEQLYSICAVESWNGLCRIVAGDQATMGVKNDGTVLWTGFINYESNLSSRNNIVDLVVTPTFVMGLESNGTAFLIGESSFGYSPRYWKNLKLPKY